MGAPARNRKKALHGHRPRSPGTLHVDRALRMQATISRRQWQGHPGRRWLHDAEQRNDGVRGALQPCKLLQAVLWRLVCARGQPRTPRHLSTVPPAHDRGADSNGEHARRGASTQLRPSSRLGHPGAFRDPPRLSPQAWKPAASFEMRASACTRSAVRLSSSSSISSELQL